MIKGKFDGVELQDLKKARDEAKLQAHLFSAEMRTQWEKLEKDWRVMQRNLKQSTPDLKKSIESVSRATTPLFGDLRAAYDRLVHQVREKVT